MVVIRYFWVNLEASDAGVTAATVRKYNGWDEVLVSIPWGAGAEWPCGGMPWLSCASPNRGRGAGASSPF